AAAGGDAALGDAVARGDAALGDTVAYDAVAPGDVAPARGGAGPARGNAAPARGNGTSAPRNAVPARGGAPGGPAPAHGRPRAGALGVAAWLISAGVFFSVLGDLQIRYLDAFAPAVALALGGGVAALARWSRLPAALLAAAVLIVPAAHSLAVVRHADSDSGH